jgi:hypothetical protein
MGTLNFVHAYEEHSSLQIGTKLASATQWLAI